MRIGFFGYGNMGKAVGVAMEAQFPGTEIVVYTPSGKLKLSEVPHDLDYYVLAFKPQSLDDFHFNFSPDHKIISLLAGVSLDKLIQKFKVQKIVRFMPNIPALYREGASLAFFPQAFSPTESQNTVRLLEATGKVFLMNSEDQLDRVTGFSGSGPGLIFELARIFEEELNQLTNYELPARDIVAQTFLGAATLMAKDTSSFTDLREKVTSKKGVTFEALETLKSHELQNIFKKAFQAAYKRTQDFR